MRRIRNLMFVGLFGLLALGACMSDSQPPEEMPLGSTSQSTSYIKSAAELETYLQTATSSPLDRLSPAAKQRFLSSLMFTRYGLASYDHSDLNALSATDAAEIRALFRPAAPAGAVSPRGEIPGTQCRPLQGGCVTRLNFSCDPSLCHGA
jgi:hypothetical protein